MENMEEMRAQFEALNRKLERQNIINERMMRQAMRGRVRTAKRQYIISICGGIYMLTFGLWSLYSIGFSMLFLTATLALVVICFCVVFYIGGDVLTGSLFDRPMLEIAERAAEKVRITRRWHKVASPLIVIWTTWLCCDCGLEGNLFRICALVLGLVICGFFGWIFTQKSIVSGYEALIRDIEDLTETQD